MDIVMPTVPAPPWQPVPAETVATWPDGTFLENLAFGPDGALYVTVWLQGEIYRLQPPFTEPELLCRPGFHPLGIAFEPDGSALLSGHRAPGFDVRPADAPDGFWRLTADGSTELVADAHGARFLNGLCRASAGRFLGADSSGSMWLIDAVAGNAERVADGPLLGPIDPAAPLPAANGIRIREDHVYVANWVKAQIVRAPLDRLDAFEVVLDELIVDDFAFGSDGTLYGATHLETIVSAQPDGTRATIAGREQGAHGATACAFGPGPDGRERLYVITDGGVVADSPEPARLIALEVGQGGLAPS